MSKRDKLEQQGALIVDALMQGTAIKSDSAVMPGEQCIQKCQTMIMCSYDGVLGGFGNHPKFPQPGSITASVHFIQARFHCTVEII